MFDVGFWELLLIALVGLVVIGPERLPAVARTLGHWTGRVRHSAGRFRDDLEREFRAQELRTLLDEEATSLREPLAAVTDSLNEGLRGDGPDRGDADSQEPAPGSPQRVVDGQ